MMRRAITLLALALGCLSAPAHAVTATQVAGSPCGTSATTCTATATANVPAGSYVLVVGAFGTGNNGTITVTDNGGNCTAYTTVAKASSNNATPFVAVCPSTTAALASGTGSFTATSSSTSNVWVLTAWVLSGVSGVDKAGTAVAGTMTSGTATSFATTPALSYSSEWALGLVAVGNGGAADSLGAYTGGFAAFGSINGGNSRPELFLSAQTLTSGTATLGATPTVAASRNDNAITVLFIPTGAARKGCFGLLLGAGC